MMTVVKQNINALYMYVYLLYFDYITKRNRRILIVESLRQVLEEQRQPLKRLKD